MDITVMVQLLSQLRSFRLRDSWNRKLLEEYQAHALRLLREYAYTHSPFYQRFHQGLYDAPLQQLPILTKTMMMEQFDELVTCGCQGRSTGEPFWIWPTWLKARQKR
jgi:phenylacetate-CoA ligase